MKDELGCKIITEFVELRAKTYIYLIDDGSEDKKSKRYKKMFHKKTLKFEKYKNCLESTQLENKISYLEENKININNLQKNYEEFIRNNKSILKTPQSERHNVFTEEINKIALSSNDDKRMQLIDSIKAYAYGRSKDLASEKEVINNIIKPQQTSVLMNTS